MEEINKRIKSEICYSTLEQLTDENLLPEYKKCKSVQKRVQNFENVLQKYVDEDKE